MSRCSNVIPLVLLLSVAPACADYAEDTGFVRLSTELGAAMPTGAGIGVSQVEGGPQDATGTYYLPQTGTGTFAGTGWDC
jgi:hypothetical protein